MIILLPSTNDAMYPRLLKKDSHESNWLPAPSGNFILWLRAYLPDQTILDGEYKLPPIVEAQSGRA